MKDYRRLTEDEILQLKSQSCLADDWGNVSVAEGFNCEYVHHTRFSGEVKLGVFEAEFTLPGGIKKHSGLRHVTLHNVSVGDNCCIENIQNYIAEPILVIENNPQLDITASQNTGTYIFKVKNYNNQKQTEIDLKYYIQVISDLDKSIELKLYENGKQIKFENNKTDYIKISKDSKKENEYKLEITYNKDKSVSVNDIIQQIQVKVHTEQEKA